MIKELRVNLQLSKLLKQKTHPITYQDHFHKICEQHPKHFYIFTDGSEDDNKIACTDISHKKALPEKNSILTAEAYAIDLALDIISDNNYKNSIRFSLCINNTKK